MISTYFELTALRVLIVYELGRGNGHLARLAALAQAFDALGHQVDLGVPDDASLKALDGAPVRAVHASPRLKISLEIYNQVSSLAQIAANYGFADANLLESLAHDWHALFTRARAEIVVCEYAPSAIFAARLTGLPVVRFGTGFFTPPPGLLPNLRPWVARTADAQWRADSVADAAMTKVCAVWDKPEIGFVELLECTPAYWTTWPEIDHLGPRLSVTYAGPLQSLAGGIEPAWPTGNGPRTFVYMPSKARGAKLIYAALRRLGWPTIWHSRDADLIPKSDTIAVSAEPLNIQQVLASTPLIIARTGHGLASEAIRTGCRQVFIPDQLEGALLAFRLGRQHLGSALPPFASTDEAAAWLYGVVHDAAMARAIESTHQRYSQYDSQSAADVLAKNLIGAVK